MQRRADPYRDLDVIDSRAPRTNQAVVGAVSVLAVATGWWWLLALLALQLAVGLTFGRRYCLPCLAYFELIQPRFGEGPLEDRARLLVKHTTRTVPARVDEIVSVIDIATLENREVAGKMELNDLGVVRFRLAEPLAVDPYARNRGTGAFILIDEATNDTVGAGMVIDAA